MNVKRYEKTHSMKGKFATVFSDITRCKRDKETLKSREALLQHLIEIMPIVCFTFNRQGRILSWNRAAEEVYGYTKKEAVGASVYDLIVTPMIKEEMDRVILGVFAGRRFEMSEWQDHDKEGHLGWRIGNASPVMRPDGSVDFGVNMNIDITRRKLAEEALKASESKFSKAFHSSPDALTISTLKDGKYIDVNYGFTQITGLLREEVIGKTSMQLNMWANKIDRVHLTSILQEKGTAHNVAIDFKNRSGEIRSCLASAELIELDGELLILAVTRDITIRKREQEELKERARLAELTAEAGVVFSKEATLQVLLQYCAETLVKHLDAAFARIWTLNEPEMMLELQASAGMYTHINGSHSRIPVGKFKIGMIAGERKAHLTNNVIGDPRIHNQEWAKKENMVAFAGHPLIMENRLLGVMAVYARKPLTDIALKALASIADQISLGIERKRTEEELKKHKQNLERLVEIRTAALRIKTEQLEEAAITDDLTGLLNRRGFFTLAVQQFKLASRTKSKMAILYLDIDGFKGINDECGHNAGDQVLKDAAGILIKTFRDSDIIARIGGDEFVVLITEANEPDIDKIVTIHVKNNLRFFNTQVQRDYALMFSMGLSLYNPGKPCSIETLMTQADKLMYEDKKHHKSDKQDVPAIERRKFKRFGTDDKCIGSLGNVTGMIRIKDMSQGGIRLRTQQPLRTNKLQKIKKLPFNNHDAAMKAVVIWSSPEKKIIKSNKEPIAYESGLKFIGLSDHDKQSLNDIIAMHAEMIRP